MSNCVKCQVLVINDYVKQKRMCYVCFRKHENNRNKVYYAKNKDKINKVRADLKQGKQTEINAYQREQYHKNHEAYRSNINKRYQERYNTDIEFRLGKTIKKGMQNYFSKERKSSFEFIGCSQAMFKDWIEYQTQFYDLDIKCHGTEWHIDHVVPCAYFDLTTLTTQTACFNWVNLRPYPCIDNISKSNKIVINDIKIQEQRYKSYLFTNGKKFNRADIKISTVLTTTLHEQLCKGTRGNDLGNFWTTIQVACLDNVKTSETGGQSAAKLLLLIIKLASVIQYVKRELQTMRIMIEEGSETKRKSPAYGWVKI